MTKKFALLCCSASGVIDHEEGKVLTPRVEFHFIKPYTDSLTDGTNAYYAVDSYKFLNKKNEMQTTQILKNGETLELISNPGNNTTTFFYGWYVVNPYVSDETDEYGIGKTDGKLYYTWPANPSRIAFESPITITGNNIDVGDTISWSLNGVTGSGAVDKNGNVHVFLAPVFDKYHYVNFMQYARNTAGLSGPTNLMTRKLLALGSAASAEVKISDIRSASTDAVHRIFKGWEYNTGTEQAPNWTEMPTVDFTGAEMKDPGRDGVYLTVHGLEDTADINLYPIFVEARWVDFVSGIAGSGASFVGSRFLLAWGASNPADMPENHNESVFTSLTPSARQGYDFEGWYAFANMDPKTGEITNLNKEEPVTITYLSGTEVKTVTVSTRAVKVTDGSGNIFNCGAYSVVDQGDGTGALTNSEGPNKMFKAENGNLRFYESLDRLKLSANWTPAASLITIVYWTENAEDDSYFSSAVKTITTEQLRQRLGREFATDSTVQLSDLKDYQENGVSILARDYLDDVAAVPAGEQIFYDLNEGRSDVSRQIVGQSTTMFNVYFSRKIFTLVFHIGRDGYISTSGEQTSPNNGSWMQMFYNDATATGLDSAEGTKPSGSRGASATATATMTINGETYDNQYATTAENVKNDYLPGSSDHLYTITAKYGAYIGDQWPTPTNKSFAFTVIGANKEMYTWSAYYESRFTKLANDRKGSGQNWHPDINGVYSYMSAELCANRDGTAIINENQVHHFVAYFGDPNKAGVRKNYHILYEAIDGTYDPTVITADKLIPGSSFSNYPRTTWTQNVANADPSLIEDRIFYEIEGSPFTVISNLDPWSQIASEYDGYEYIYSCYDTPRQNEHHNYFIYTPKLYTLPFNSTVDISEDNLGYSTEWVDTAGGRVVSQTGTSVFTLKDDQTVTVRNTRETPRKVKVKKVVNADNNDGTFDFMLVLLNGTVPIAHYPVYTDAADDSNSLTTDTNGMIHFNLKHNEERMLSIPYGSKLIVTETSVTDYTPEVAMTDDEENSVVDEDTVFNSFTVSSVTKGGTITFTNTPVMVKNLYFDKNGGNWTEESSSFEMQQDGKYKITEDQIISNAYRPSDPTWTENGKIFLGWTTNADIAAHTDFSSTSTVTWGSTTITPEEGSNVLEKIKDTYIWDFSNPPPYGQTLYAVWSDAVTVTFDVLYSSNPNANPRKLHTWNGPDTVSTQVPYVYYRNSETDRYISYTLAKGDKVPKPNDPTPHSDKSTWSFLRWLYANSTTDSFRYSDTKPSNNNISIYAFDFSQPVVQDEELLTSWILSTRTRKYTFMVKNVIDPGVVGEEFDYTFTLSSIMNSSGTYHTSTPKKLPPVMRLKHNETYTIEITAIRYKEGTWNQNSLYMVVTDRDGTVVYSGHLLQYVKNATKTEFETSDYEVTMTVTQTPKTGYSTTVTSDGAPSVVTTNSDGQSFTFRSALGGTAKAGQTGRTTTWPAENAVDINMENLEGYEDVAETIIFTNSTGVILYPSPTGIVLRVAPYAVMLVVGIALAAVAIRGSKRNKKDDD